VPEEEPAYQQLKAEAEEGAQGRPREELSRRDASKPAAEAQRAPKPNKESLVEADLAAPLRDLRLCFFAGGRVSPVGEEAA